MAKILIGTSGWSYAHWFGRYYPSDLPRSEMLSFYAQELNTVEVNASFYRLPFEGMIKGWYRKTPADFKFSLKGPRKVTHLLNLVDCEEDIKVFLDRVRGLNEKLGVILYQIPPSLKKDIPRLAKFLDQLPKDLRYTIEFRDDSWSDEETFELLKNKGVAYCIISAPHLACHIKATADFVYIRMHGITHWYRYHYSYDDLKFWAGEIRKFIDQGLDVYCYFNNDFEAYAIKNAKELMELIK